MKKIFLLSLCITTFAFCNSDLLVEENIIEVQGGDINVNQIQEGFLQELFKSYSELDAWYLKASSDEKVKLHQWITRLVDASINLIRKSDDVFFGFLEEFEEITQLTNVKLVTEIDIALQPTETENTKAQAEQTPELTRDITEQLNPVKEWYESATDGEKKQLDDLLEQLSSYIQEITANADEAKMSGIADAIRALTGVDDMRFTLSFQVSID